MLQLVAVLTCKPAALLLNIGETSVMQFVAIYFSSMLSMMLMETTVTLAHHDGVSV